MSIGIYAFFDLEDNCLYIGQSSNIEKRKTQHLKCLRGNYHRRQDFNNWFNLNTESNLSFKILEECLNDTKIKNALEIKYFNILQPKFYGQIPSMQNNFVQSDETKFKISNSVKKYNTARGAYVNITCPCGKVFEVMACRLKIFCSRTCADLSRKSKLNFDEVSFLYSSGLSLHQIGEKLNVSYRTVHNFMLKNNIPRRIQNTNTLR